jgi:hypothetical protein
MQQTGWYRTGTLLLLLLQAQLITNQQPKQPRTRLYMLPEAAQLYEWLRICV